MSVKALLALTLITLGCDDGAGSAGALDRGADTPDATQADAGATDASAPVDASAAVDAGPVGCPAGAPFDPTECRYTPRVRATTIESLEFELMDMAGGRTVPALLRYPTDADGPVGLVLWAHAGSWSSTAHTSHRAWSQLLAEAGYAVLHTAQVKPDAAQLEVLCAFVDLPPEAECHDISLDRPEDADPDANPFKAITITRPGDVALIVDRLPMILGRVTERTGLVVDPEILAVAGWSGGSQSVLQTAGATRMVADVLPPFSAPHPGPKAFVALSPQGPGFSNFFAEPGGPTSWDAVRGATLVITGDGDVKGEDDPTGPNRRQVFDLMPPGDKALFYSTATHRGVQHQSFGLDGREDTPELRVLKQALVSVTLAWIDAHARGDAGARAWLEAGTAVRAANDEALWETK